MRIRADLHVNSGSRKLILVAVENEKHDHLALKLAAYLLFWEEDLVLEASAKHPALAGQDFRPDLLGTDITGAVSLWVERGNTSQNKLVKVLRRWPSARVVVFKEDPVKARRLRADLERDTPDASRVEIFHWPAGGFSAWERLLDEKTEVYGEAGGAGFNLVVNEQVYLADLLKA